MLGKKSFNESLKCLLSFSCLSLLLIALSPKHGNAIDCEGIKYPFYPSLLRSSIEVPVDKTEFKQPKSCRACHILTLKQWDGSSHSHAFEDPIFLAMWEMGSKETQGKINRLCLGCHAPIGLLTSEVKAPEDEPNVTEISQNGIYCDFCHTVTDTTHECARTKSPHNASFNISPGNIKTGPIDNCESKFHESAFLKLHTESEFCANCHNYYSHESGFKIIKTYEEWKSSVYAQKGIVCQDCHMMPVELATEAADKLDKPKNPGKASTLGPKRDNIHEHKFVGGSPVIKKGAPSSQHVRDAEKRLKDAARLEAETLASEGKGVLRVRIYNERAGHNLPTGMPGFRQVWLEVSIADKNGVEMLHSGMLDNKGRLPEGTVCFGAEAVDKNGLPTNRPWAIEGFKSDNTIPAKGEAIRDFEFKIPEDDVWPLKAKIVLRYRGFPQSLLDELMPDLSTTIPVIDMAIKELTISSL